jgi:hypothetical protein
MGDVWLLFCKLVLKRLNTAKAYARKEGQATKNSSQSSIEEKK